MANFIPNSWKEEILKGTHTLAHTYKMALISSMSGYSQSASTVFDGTNEIVGTGYTAGGVTLEAPTVVSVGNRKCLSFGGDPTWADATFVAAGAVIYDTSASNKIVCVFDFGSNVSATNGTFVVDLGNQSSTGVSLTFAASGKTLTRAAGSFVSDGYKVGHTIVTSSSSNPGPFTIVGLSSLALTVAETVVNEGPVSTNMAAVIIYL